MTATLDPRPIPPYAVQFWSDGQTIFAAIPHKQGAPYITKHPHSETGLASALRLLATRYSDASATTKYIPVRDFNAPKVGSVSQHANARDVLKRLGILR